MNGSRFARSQRLTIVTGMLLFVILIVVLQIWLLTASVNAYLGGDRTLVIPAMLASLVCFGLTAGLLRSASYWAHTPVVARSFCTCSVGCAPLRSHASAESASMETRDGSSRGAYWPMISMNRPSRGERPSATTTRYVGCFFFPTRMRRIFTATARVSSRRYERVSVPAAA